MLEFLVLNLAQIKIGRIFRMQTKRVFSSAKHCGSREDQSRRGELAKNGVCIIVWHLPPLTQNARAKLN